MRNPMGTAPQNTLRDCICHVSTFVIMTALLQRGQNKVSETFFSPFQILQELIYSRKSAHLLSIAVCSLIALPSTERLHWNNITGTFQAEPNQDFSRGSSPKATLSDGHDSDVLALVSTALPSAPWFWKDQNWKHGRMLSSQPLSSPHYISSPALFPSSFSNHGNERWHLAC